MGILEGEEVSTIHYITVMDLDTQELRSFEVPRSVSVYIKQLEHKVWQISNLCYPDKAAKRAAKNSNFAASGYETIILGEFK